MGSDQEGAGQSFPINLGGFPTELHWTGQIVLSVLGSSSPRFKGQALGKRGGFVVCSPPNVPAPFGLHGHKMGHTCCAINSLANSALQVQHFTSILGHNCSCF